MEGALQKQSFGGLVLAAGQVEVGAHVLGGLAQDALGFGGKFRGVTVSSQAGAVVPEVAAFLGLFEVVEVVARILATECKQLVDQKREGKQRGARVKAVVAELKLAELAARVGVGLVDVHRIALAGPADG